MSDKIIEYEQDERGIYEMPEGTPAKKVPEMLNHNFKTLSSHLANKVNVEDVEQILEEAGKGGALTASATYENGIFTLSGLPDALSTYCTVYFVAPAAHSDGDRFQIAGRVYSLYDMNLNDVAGGAFAAGALVALNVDTAAGRVFLGGGGGTGSYGILPAQTQITVLAADASANVTLQNPGGDAYAGTLLVVKLGGEVPAGEADGTVHDAGKSEIYTVTGLSNGRAYVVRAFAYNSRRQFQTDTTGAVESFTPSDKSNDPPGDVLNFKATISGKTVILTWQDPANSVYSEWGGTMIRRKADGYPADETDGDLVVNTTNRDQYRVNGYVDGGLDNGVTYYYQAFPYSTEGIYNTGTVNRLEATPIPVDFEYLTSFVSNASWSVPDDGWYRIFLFGRSGNGGAGGDYPGAGGSGGGSGGFAASLLYMEKGTLVHIGIGSDSTEFGESSSPYYMYAGRGDDGEDGTINGPATFGGRGGNASGGNIINITGFSGGHGGRGYSSSASLATVAYPGSNNGASAGELRSTQGGAPGGGGARVPGSEYCRYVIADMSHLSGGAGGGNGTSQNGGAGASAGDPISGINIVVTGAGSGGGGAGRRAKSDGYYTPGFGGDGGTGQCGAVLIEIDADQDTSY